MTLSRKASIIGSGYVALAGLISIALRAARIRVGEAHDTVQVSVLSFGGALDRKPAAVGNGFFIGF
jgi:hypothetical protein